MEACREEENSSVSWPRRDLRYSNENPLLLLGSGFWPWLLVFEGLEKYVLMNGGDGGSSTRVWSSS